MAEDSTIYQESNLTVNGAYEATVELDDNFILGCSQIPRVSHIKTEANPNSGGLYIMPVIHVTFVCGQNSETLKLSADRVEDGFIVTNHDFTADPANITEMTRAVVHKPVTNDPSHAKYRPRYVKWLEEDSTVHVEANITDLGTEYANLATATDKALDLEFLCGFKVVRQISNDKLNWFAPIWCKLD